MNQYIDIDPEGWKEIAVREINNGTIKNVLDIKWSKATHNWSKGNILYIVNNVTPAIRVMIVDAMIIQYQYELSAFTIIGGEKTLGYLKQLKEYLSQYNNFNIEYIKKLEAENKTLKSKLLLKELDTPVADKYFNRALECGYMKQSISGYKWLFGGNKGQARLGYFCYRVFDTPRPINELEKLFEVSKLSASITNAGFEPKRADVKKWRKEMDDKIFF